MTHPEAAQPIVEITAQPDEDAAHRPLPTVEVVSATEQRPVRMRLRPPTRLFPNAPPRRRREI